jgi:AcrR family transcriptional regulator
MNENDLRVRRTRNLLKKALIDLLATQDYSDISIREVTTRAQVGYRTFFRHYESMDMLLQSIINEIADDFLHTRLPPGISDAPIENTRRALQYAEAHAEIFRLLLRTSAADQLAASVYAVALVEGELFYGDADMPGELVVHHFATSIISFMRWWLENDMPYSVDEMTVYINRLLLIPIRGISEG